MTNLVPDRKQETRRRTPAWFRQEGAARLARLSITRWLAVWCGAWLSAHAGLASASSEPHPGSSGAPPIDLSRSVKCFDAPSPCVTRQTVISGTTITFVLVFVNGGTEEATGVRFEDDLTDLGPGCLVTPIPDAECVPGGGCHGHPCIVDRQPSATEPFSASISNMPSGCAVEVTIRATVEPGATGTCCNEGGITFTGPAPGGSFTTPPACFGIAASRTCDINRVVILDLTPTTYSNACSGADVRLPGPPYVPAVGVHQDLPDTVPSGPPGELSLYQFDCACSDVIYLTTRWSVPGSGVVHMSY